MAGILGRAAGAAIGAIFSKERAGDPIKGALIGAATMFVARRLLPARIAGIGATIAAGYVAKKLADREIARLDAPTGAKRPKRRAPANSARTANVVPDRTVSPTARSTKLPAAREPEPATAPPANP
jgi:hypothetical protein